MTFTRRQLVLGGAALMADPRGFYRLLSEVSQLPARRRTSHRRGPEQHVLDDLAVIVDNGVEVIVPPLHERVITARVVAGGTRAELRDARASLERALSGLDADYANGAGGLGTTVAWGTPYFRRLVPGQARRLMPIDLRATRSRRRTVHVLEESERFPSDPLRMLLEQNDVAFLLRSDHLEAIDDAHDRLVRELDGLVEATSIRSGFIGGGFGGATSLPKRLAVRAGIAGADRMPDTAQLYLGFTSTVRHALGPRRIANIETLGYAKLPTPYFVGGTHMHLSHLFENLNAWYLNFDEGERVAAMFHPRLDAGHGAQTISQSPSDVQSSADVRADYARRRSIGHAGAIQTASRLQHDVVSRDGTVYRRGTTVPQRADVNTLDNPFAWTAHPGRDRFRRTPAAGTHFVVFNPTADDFRRMRLAMDGVLPDARLAFPERSNVDPTAASPALVGQGINSVFHATHRQNFLVPPRAHRSFPLSELRS